MARIYNCQLREIVYNVLERESMTIWHRFAKNKFCRSNRILPLASIIHLLLPA